MVMTCMEWQSREQRPSCEKEPFEDEEIIHITPGPHLIKSFDSFESIRPLGNTGPFQGLS